MRLSPSFVRRVLASTAVIAALAATGCSGEPDKHHLQFVARDAWNKNCASKATVEKFEATNKKWKIKDQVFTADVKATFKLIDDCKGLPLVGKSYKAFESADFEKKGLELSACKAEGEKGWSLPGKEGSRCFTGPTSVPDELKPKSVKK